LTLDAFTTLFLIQEEASGGKAPTRHSAAYLFLELHMSACFCLLGIAFACMFQIMQQKV